MRDLTLCQLCFLVICLISELFILVQIVRVLEQVASMFGFLLHITIEVQSSREIVHRKIIKFCQILTYKNLTLVVHNGKQYTFMKNGQHFEVLFSDLTVSYDHNFIIKKPLDHSKPNTRAPPHHYYKMVFALQQLSQVIVRFSTCVTFSIYPKSHPLCHLMSCYQINRCLGV